MYVVGFVLPHRTQKNEKRRTVATVGVAHRHAALEPAPQLLCTSIENQHNGCLPSLQMQQTVVRTMARFVALNGKSNTREQDNTHTRSSNDVVFGQTPVGDQTIQPSPRQA